MGGGSATARTGVPSEVRDGRPSPSRPSAWLDRRFARVGVLPTSVLMPLMFGFPLLFSLYPSLKSWSPDQSLFAGQFTGIDNYQDLLTDHAFVVSLGITFACTAAALAADLGIALLLSIDRPAINLFRTGLIIPRMITPVVATFCWKLLLDLDHGIVD